MKKNIVFAIAGLAMIVLAFLLYQVFKTPEEASAPIAAIPVTVETAAPTAQAAATEVPTVVPTAESMATEAPAAATEVPAAATEAPPAATEAPAASAPVIFEIQQDRSQARFIINEVLRGTPTRVVGATDQVAGQIAVDPANPAVAQVGTILVNARTLATDNDFRNRAIKNQILSTNTFEFVTFEPTQVTGLPASVTVGQALTFQVVGNLTVRDVTKEVTFDVTATPVSETEISGLASLTIPYRDLGLSIPDVPSVDTVEDTVLLELEFVAVAQ